MNTKNLYRARFSPEEQKNRTLLWKSLYDCFLSQFIRSSDMVCDIGAGTCEFLVAANAKKKIAVDPYYVSSSLKDGIFYYPSIRKLPKSFQGAADVVMLSNVLEHLKDRGEILSLLSDIRDLLKPGGSLLIIQPVIDLAGNRYWDFFDHIVPITRKGLLEALTMSGFEVRMFIPRFLPYTTKTAFLLPPWLLRMYLFIPWRLRLFAGQCFVLTTKQ